MIKKLQKNSNFNLFSVAIENSPLSVIITNASWEIVYVNDNFIGFTGYTKEEILGKNPLFFKSQNISKDRLDEIMDIVKSGENWSGEFYITRAC